VPVVALEGKNFASRVSGSLLKAAHLPDLICHDINAYIKKAIDLIQDKNKLAKMKSHLIEQRNKLPLFDAYNLTIEIESAYKKIYDDFVSEQKK